MSFSGTFARSRLVKTLPLAMLVVVSVTVAQTPDMAWPDAMSASSPPLLRFDNPSYSPDGKWLAVSDGLRDALYLYNVADKTTIGVASSPSSGYAYNWAGDSTRLGLKLLVPSTQGPAPHQVPAYFDVGKQQLIALHPPVRRAGVPSFAADGRIAFTIDQELWITDESGAAFKTFSLDNYANLAPISPDGTQVAYNDRDDHICVLDVSTGGKRLLTTDENAYFNPIWSPDSSRLIVSTVSGRLKAVEVSSGTVHELDEGCSPSWGPDSRTVFYTKVDRIPGVRVNSADICRIEYNGSSMTYLTRGSGMQAVAGRVAPDGSRVAFVSLSDGEAYEAPLVRSGGGSEPDGGTGIAGLADGAEACVLGAAVKIDMDGAGLSSAPLAESMAEAAGAPIEPEVQTTISKAVPYIHQVYDTPDDFNGHWACGATSAMMAISYYERLPYWDCTCSSPYSHVSHYGRYICQVYTYNGYTYNIGGKDPNNKWFYGGYGYIIQNDWEDTKGHMRDYFINHNISSSVDWSPTWSELQTEVNNQYPFVLLNSLTTSGHYITTKGYVDGQHTAIFNDPYGNKNTPGYPSYDGAGARYDWPGYNNGYQNLNTVHCFIYARSGFGPTITQHPSNQVVAPGGTATFTVAATGATSYQWQKNGSNLSNGGRISGATSTTLQITSAEAGDQGSYQCVVSNANGSTTSNSATLTVTGSVFMVESRSGGQNYGKYSETGAWGDSTGKSSAAGVTAGIGSRYGSTYRTVAGEKHASFKADLSTAGNYEVFATWGANSNRRTPILHRITHAGGTTDMNVDQAATADVWVSLGTYTFSAGTDVGQVDVSNLNIDASGSMYADAIKWEYRGGTAPPTITQHPAPQNVCSGATAAFTVGATGSGTLTYRWQKNGANLSDGGHYAGATTPTLTVSSADGGDVGEYRCVVTNANGSTNSNTASLTLRSATVITQQPAAQSVCIGATAVFAVAATGDGVLAYQWQRNGANLSDGGHYSGTTTPTLTITPAGGTDLGTYRCVVTGGCGSVTSDGAGLAFRTATTISQHPSGANVCPGATAVFTVTASGDGAVAYQWQKNGADVADGGHYSGATTPTLTVSQADSGDVADYRCIVTAGCGSATSNAAALALMPTTITQQPSTQSVCLGGTTAFTVGATGIALAFQWQKNNVDLTEGGHYSGVATPVLTISSADAGDSVNYRCVVTGACGTATSNSASLSFKPATVITQHPADQEICTGAWAYFVVAGAGDGPLSYQWRKDGADLGNNEHYSGVTTPTLTIRGVEDTDVGEYQCVVAAGCGSAASNAAVLTIRPTVQADLDRDGDVDLTDFSFFQMCFNGPNRPAQYGCSTHADLDDDADVDLLDFAILQGCFNGPNRPAQCL